MSRHRWVYGLVLVAVGAVAAVPLAAQEPVNLLLAQAAHGATAEAEPGHEGGGHEGGAPLSFKSDLALWSLVTFIVFLLVLRKFAWEPLVAGLDQREAKIRNDLTSAENARRQSEQLLREHEVRLGKVQDEVREILAEARRDAEHTKQDILAAAQREAEAMRQRAVGDIERARDQALSELFDYVARNVADATEHVLGRSLNDQDQDRLIHEALAQLGTNGARR